MHEEVLIRRLKGNDRGAYRELIDLYKNKVLNTCYHFVHDRIDAEDIAQEVFIQVFLSIGKFKGNCSIGTWIYRISVNKCLYFIRKKSSSKRSAKILSIFNLSKKDNDIMDSDLKTPLKILENKNSLENLKLCILKLPENQRTAFVLTKFEDLSYKETAEIMELSVSAVESLLQRAKNNLKKYLTLMKIETNVF
jgi:RNA polymerase sigma factor (sigma-70 family)